MLLVSSDKFDSGTTVRLEDSCAHGTELITLVVTAGEITKVDPPTVTVQQGGG